MMHFMNGKVARSALLEQPILRKGDKKPASGKCKVYQLNAFQLQKIKEGEIVDTSEQKVIDIYFASGDKKRFDNIADLATLQGWMKLTKTDGKDILINSQNVNFVDEV